MLNAVDLALLAMVMISALVGLWRGLMVEVLSLLAWIAAFWLAFRFGEPVSGLFVGLVDAVAARLALAYALVFIAALAIGGLVTWLLGKLVQSTGLSGPDRLFGMGFGVLRGVALGGVLVLVLGFTPLSGESWWQQSRLLPGFERVAGWMRAALPPEAAREVHFEPRWQQIDSVEPVVGER
jgi:membrane protein required for colicin V production